MHMPLKKALKVFYDFYMRKIVVATSGHFNPLHKGHIRYLKEAKKLGDWLVVIVNNDEQVKLKGSVPFMNEKERKEIIEALRCVDEVVISIDKDRSVVQSLNIIKPDIFAKGGDSTPNNVPEIALCKKLGIQVVFEVGGKKVQSSSKLIEHAKS